MIEWPNVDMAALRAWRTDRVLALMRERKLDHLVLTGFDNIRYATDYRSQVIGESFDWCAAVVDSDGAAKVFVPWVDEVVAHDDHAAPAVRSLHPLPSWSPAVAQAEFWGRALGRELSGARRVGFELMYPEVLGQLQGELGSAELVPVANDLFDLRRSKHPTEVTLLEAASLANAAAANAGLARAKPGMTDFEVLGLIMCDLQTNGVEFLSHSLCNHRRGSGDWFAAGSVLHEGDPFFLDIGCYGPGGYASDIARTGFVGEPRAELRAAYDVLLNSYEVAQQTARAGALASSVQAAVNDFLEGKGYQRTPYAVGHGVGLRACEMPTISRADLMVRDETLVEGSVIAIEPETAVEINGELIVLKIEDNFVVETDGARLLSRPSDALQTS